MISNFVALVVEDDAFQREHLADLLKSGGWRWWSANGEVAELMLASAGPDLRARHRCRAWW
jgi:hypothetical protein